MGGSCGLLDSKCNYSHLCCGVATPLTAGAKTENICGNGKGAAEPIKIGLVSYNHVCNAVKMAVSVGSLIAAMYYM